jgi:hypothetical protein
MTATDIIVQIDAENLRIHEGLSSSSWDYRAYRIAGAAQAGLHHVELPEERVYEVVKWIGENFPDADYTFSLDDMWFASKNLAFEVKMTFG